MAQEELSPQLGGDSGTVQMSKCHGSAYKESSLLSGNGGGQGDTWSCVPEKPAEVHLQFSWDLWDGGGRGRGGGPFGLPELSSHLLFTTAFLITWCQYSSKLSCLSAAAKNDESCHLIKKV